MPHSLRAKIKGLRYKKIITDKDCDRLCKALDNEDVLDKISKEIKEYYINNHFMGEHYCTDVLEIIDKYR